MNQLKPAFSTNVTFDFAPLSTRRSCFPQRLDARREAAKDSKVELYTQNNE
jgi:hypothetical protein